MSRSSSAIIFVLTENQKPWALTTAQEGTFHSHKSSLRRNPPTLVLPRRGKSSRRHLIQGCMDGKERMRFMCGEENTVLESTGSGG